MMIGALGIASAQNKLSVAYGAEAGAMDPLLQKMCGRYCRDSLVITRNPESQEVLGKLGVATELGTDTAWTFEPLGPEYGRKALRDAGWDGATPVLAVCPINPFCWPVKPSLAKWIAHSVTGAYKKSHYRTIYFHRSGRDVDAAYEKYLSAMAAGVKRYRKDAHRVSRLVAWRCSTATPASALRKSSAARRFFPPTSYNMYEIVSILRACDRMLSSRFPRHRHLDARGRALRGRHHGRAHPQPDARARPRASADERGRSGSGGQDRRAPCARSTPKRTKFATPWAAPSRAICN